MAAQQANEVVFYTERGTVGSWWKAEENHAALLKHRLELNRIGAIYANPLHPPRKPVKLVIFGLFGTLFKSKSGDENSTDADDWQWLADIVRRRMSNFRKKGYRVAIFFNHLYEKYSEVSGGFQPMMMSLAERLPLVTPIYVPLVLTAQKPDPIMFRIFLNDLGICPTDIDYANSMVVGCDGGRPGDSSDLDIKFAANIGLQFFYPESFFQLNQKIRKKKKNKKKKITRMQTKKKITPMQKKKKEKEGEQEQSGNKKDDAQPSMVTGSSNNAKAFQFEEQSESSPDQKSINRRVDALNKPDMIPSSNDSPQSLCHDLSSLAIDSSSSTESLVILDYAEACFMEEELAAMRPRRYSDLYD